MDSITLLLGIVVVVVSLVVVLALVFMVGSRVFISRCLGLVPTDSFTSPCHVTAMCHSVYGRGFFPGDPMADTKFLREAFVFYEQQGELTGMPNYSAECGCPRLFKLSPSASLRREKAGEILVRSIQPSS